MEFSYNLEHQMIHAKISKNNITQNYRYSYDPFGRRVSKTDEFGTTYFTWDGNRLLSEKRGTKEQTYIYEQDGFVPLATLDQANNISYYHTDHLGTPQEMTNTQGEVVWEAEYTTWGNTAKVTYKQTQSIINPEDEVAFQPLRFQGQYYDKETGLHYNRFRYYDPDVGRFTTQDPIGILGSDNFYAYAPNPMGWVDPLGLAKCRLGGRSKSSLKALRKRFEKSGGIRSKYLKSLSKQPGTVAKFGTSSAASMAIGKVPSGMVVHHKVPLFRGGTNKYSNLTLMSAKEHQARNKELHWYKDGECPY